MSTGGGSPEGSGRNDVLWDVIDDHLEEAEFLTEQWLLAARSPRFSLALLQSSLERRLEAHLDALVVGSAAVADEVLWTSITEAELGQEGRFAACGLALMADGAPASVDRAIQGLVTASKPKVRNGLQKALAMTDRSDAEEPVRLALYAADAPEVQAALLAALAARRIDPGPILGAMLSESRPPAVRLAAAQAACGAADRNPFFSAVEALLTGDDPDLRAAALRTGLIWSSRTAWRACSHLAEQGNGPALLYLAMLDGPAALPVLLRWLDVAGRRQDALFALGFTGLRDAADACLPYLDDKDLPVARLAGEALAAITGLPLDDSELAVDRPPAAPDQLPSLEDDLAEDLLPTPIDALPMPIAANVRKWWSERRVAFTLGERYLRGQRFGRDTIEEALRTGPLRRAGPLACEIAIRSGGEIQMPALRLRCAPPALPARLDGALHRPPRWR